MIVEEDGDVKLRIRLVIPPMKERILVMEGLVNRMNLGSNMPMASKAFGIPHLEAMAKEANQHQQKPNQRPLRQVLNKKVNPLNNAL